MRVDFVITELFVGGAERCLTELAIGLAAVDFQVRVFSLGRLPTGEQCGLMDRLRKADVPITSGQADSVVQIAATYRQLKSWIRESPPDVCQTFMYHANVLGTFAATASGVPCMVGGLRVAEARPLRCRIERAAVKRMHKLVCVSDAVQSFARQQLRCPDDRAVVIPNGVDAERFAATEPIAWSQIGWPDDSRVTLFVGRLHPQKGIDLLQRQIDRLAPSGSNRRLLLIGAGPLQHELESWITKVGTDRVRLLPWQPDVAPYMRASRLLILPSRYEGMPNVVLEAMAAGRPVVCSRVEGIEEILSGSIDQQSFPSGDDSAMIKLAEPFLSDEPLCETTGLANRSRAEKDFSIPAMVAAYRSLYLASRETRRRDD